MEIRTLKYFLTVAREENITKAAEVLHIAQPSLSVQMKELEEEVGKQLLIRGKRKVTLTEEGILLRKRASEIVDLVDITYDELSADLKDVSGSINIGAAETQAVSVLANIMKDINNTNKNIRFNMISGNQETIIEKLDKGLIDIALVIEPSDLTKYDYIKINNPDTFGVIVNKNNKLFNKNIITREDLENEPVIITGARSNSNEIISLVPKSMNVVATYNLINNALYMAEANLGIVICLNDLVNLDKNPNLKFIPMKSNVKLYSYVLWKKYQVLTPVTKLFLDKLKEKN